MEEKKRLEEAEAERIRNSFEQERNDMIENVAVAAKEIVEQDSILDDTLTNAELLQATMSLGYSINS